MKESTSPRGIVFIQSDQHRADCLGGEGHPFLKTPHLHRLAEEGIRFERAYTAVPVCVPARTSLLTGQWPTQHRVVANWDSEVARELPLGTPTWSRTLSEQGVRCEYVGRWHVNQDSDPCDFGFSHYLDDQDYYAWRERKGIPPVPNDRSVFGQTDPHVGPEQSKLGWLFDHALERLGTLSQSGDPFFLRIDTLEPHLPNQICEPYASLVDPAEIPPWGSFGDPLDNKPFIQKQQRRTWGVEDWTWREWAPVVARYYGEIELLDQQIGRVLSALERAGILEDTLVIYTSDHGDMCGAHGMLDKHYVMYDDVVRVPLLARWPGKIRPGSRCRDFVSATIDLPPTFLEAFSVPTPPTFQGSGLGARFAHPEIRMRDDIFSCYFGNQMGMYSQRMVANEDWKFVWNATAEDEFYHLPEDPYELTNLIGDRQHQSALEALRKRMIDWMEETGDTLLNPLTRKSILGQKGHPDL